MKDFAIISGHQEPARYTMTFYVNAMPSQSLLIATIQDSYRLFCIVVNNYFIRISKGMIIIALP